jgi:stage II sporulation protein R
MGDEKMKKMIFRFICLITVAILLGRGYLIEGRSASVQKSLENKLIRFHVIANSDSAQDQALKLKVRDKVLEYIYPKLKASKNIEESREIIKANDEAIKKIAQEVITKQGLKYTVNTEIAKTNFPIKTYGNITLPQGEYEAYRILIGSGSGQNWWCVMFPPLCFIDITKGEVANKDTEKAMKQVLSDKEYKAIDNTNSNQIVVKFKFVEMFNKLLGK